MKVKVSLFIASIIFSGLGLASPHMIHHPDTKNTPVKSTMAPSYCEVEVINYSDENIVVAGHYDDGQYLDPVELSYGEPAYYSLYYYQYCHERLFLEIYTESGESLYYGYAQVNSTVNIVPSYQRIAKVEIVSK